MFLSRIKTFRLFNLVFVLKVLFSRIYLRFLSIGLKVPKWHLNATYYVREYKSKVIEICNYFNNEINYIIEIGCGTGELINRVNINNKLGIDIDQGVITLCNRLHPKLNTLCLDVISNYDKFIDHIKRIGCNEKILLVMVNWLHIYSIEEANDYIERLLSLDKNILIIVDIYSRVEFSRNKDNKFSHDFLSLKNVKWFCSFDKIDKVRDIQIVANFKPNNIDTIIKKINFLDYYSKS